MKILLTGVTGFLGSHLAERLAARGHEVRCLVRSAGASLPKDMTREGLEIRPVDYADPNALDEAMDGVHRVFHVAGTTRARTTAEYYEGNCVLTSRLAEACLRVGGAIDRFVYVSSLSAMGPSEPGRELDETAPCRPVSHYGRSKMFAEQELRGMVSKLPLVIVRPGAIYGPRERDLFLYFQLIKRGFYPRIGRLRKYLNLAYCDDVVNGILLAGESDQAPGKTYFIGDARSHDTNEIARSIAQAIGVQARPITVPEAAVTVLGLLSEIKGRLGRTPVFFNIQKAREACAAAWDCSIARAREELGYSPAVSLDDGMVRTYRWYIGQGLLPA